MGEIKLKTQSHYNQTTLPFTFNRPTVVTEYVCIHGVRLKIMSECLLPSVMLYLCHRVFPLFIVDSPVLFSNLFSFTCNSLAFYLCVSTAS